MLQLRGLNILLTYECTSRCRHCCYRAGPGRGGTMAAGEVEGYLSAVAGGPLEWILLFGGEPFVCYDLLKAAVAAAAPLARVLVFTNGCWATGPEPARRLLGGLQEAGLDHILFFSVDAFHQEHIPLDRVATGIEAARALGYGAVEIDNRWLGDPAAAGAGEASRGGEPPSGGKAPGGGEPSSGGEASMGGDAFNRRTRQLMSALAEACDLGGVAVTQGPARLVGRAADELAGRLPRRPGTAGACTLPSYLGADLRSPTGVEIHPGGWVNLCAGVALGNARERPLAEVLGDYDPEAHPIVRELVREGPAGLLRLARGPAPAPGGGCGDSDLAGAEGWADNCHLCYQARRRLRGRYPEWLAPAAVYDHG